MRRNLLVPAAVLKNASNAAEQTATPRRHLLHVPMGTEVERITRSSIRNSSAFGIVRAPPPAVSVFGVVR